MFKINDDKSIFITRGDIGVIRLSVDDEDGNLRTFENDDVVRLQVFEKQDCGCVVLSKSVDAIGGKTEVEIQLTSKETRFCEVINKPKNYWYEIELNPNTSPQTIIGYDEQGPKIFRVFPEGESL